MDINISSVPVKNLEPDVLTLGIYFHFVWGFADIIVGLIYFSVERELSNKQTSAQMMSLYNKSILDKFFK